MMYSWIENVGRWPSKLARDQRQAALCINGRLMFREHDQRRTILIKSRVHAGGDFHSTGEGEANVHAVAHLVGGERAFDFLDDLVVRRNFRKGQRGGRAA